MKKSISILFFLVLLAFPAYAFAGLSEGCAPAVTCSSGQDYYNGSCRSHIESVSSTTPSCLSLFGAPAAGQGWNFSCGSGCFQSALTCAGGEFDIDPTVARNCQPLASSIKHTVDSLFKIWDTATTTLKRLIYMDEADATACASGQVLQWNGTKWVCATQTSSQWVTSGNHISFRSGGGSGSVGIGVANSSPTNRLQVNGGVQIDGSLYVSGGTSSVIFPDGQIGERELADDAVTTLKLANNAVGNSAQIANGTIRGQDVASTTITGGDTGNIALATITGINIANNEIDHLQLAADSVDEDNLQSNSVFSDEIDNRTIEAIDIAMGTVTSSEIANNTIIGGAAAGTGNIANNTITSWNVLDNTLTAADIATGAIASLEILDGTITSADITDGTITGTDITDGTITGTDIADAGISGTDILASSIYSSDIAPNTITGDDIASGAVDTFELADDAITSAKIDNQAITSADIGENEVKNSELALYFADLDLSPITTVLPGDYNTASSYCNGSDIAISGECEAFTAADANSRSNAIYITGFYRTNDVVGDTTVYNRTWNCRGYNSIGSNRYLRARAICLESN